MDLSQARDNLIRFLESIARPDQRIDGIADTTNLVDAGLLDSFALIQIILYLEEHHGLNLRQERIEIDQLSSIAGILSVIGGAKE